VESVEDGARVAALTRREAHLRSERAALQSGCEEAFLRLRNASSAETVALRRELADLHLSLGEIVQKLSYLPWDSAGPEHDLARILTEVVAPTGQIASGRIAKATAALDNGHLEQAEMVLTDLQALNIVPADQAARLAFGLGLIAEAEQRPWDAAQRFALAARLDPDLRSLRKARAFACETGDLTAAFRLGKGLLVLAETDGSAEDRVLAMAEHALTLEAQDRLEEAEGFLRKAVLGGRSLEHGPGPEQARHLAQLARVLDRQDRLPDAEAALRKALEVTRQTLGEGHPDYASRLNALGGVLQAQDRDDEAEPLQLKALDLARRLAGGQHPVLVDCLSGLAQLAENQGRLPVAEELYRQALSVDQELTGRTHPDHAGRLYALAEVVRAQRRMPEAEVIFRQALEVDRATIGETHRDYGVALNNLAGVVEVQGRPEEAEALYAAALAVFRATQGDLHPATLKVVKNFRALLAAHLPGSVHRAGVEALWAAGQGDAPGLTPAR
jgi:tetratricopeptide (TPR) repeat protein